MAGQQPLTCALLHDHELTARRNGFRDLRKLSSDKRSKDRMDVWTGEVIPFLPNARAGRHVVPILRVVQRGFHEIPKRDRAVTLYRSDKFLDKETGVTAVHLLQYR